MVHTQIVVSRNSNRTQLAEKADNAMWDHKRKKLLSNSIVHAGLESEEEPLSEMLEGLVSALSRSERTAVCPFFSASVRAYRRPRLPT